MNGVFNHLARLVFNDREAEVLRSTPMKSQNNKAITEKEK
jgi:hypothetical protein